MNKLKPCPFCGGTAKKVYKSSGQTIHIECEQCRAQFPKSTNENAFDEAWNSRVERTCELNGTISWEWHTTSTTFYTHSLSCGHNITTTEPQPPNYCEECGARVVGR